jgi:hypothetical protein
MAKTTHTTTIKGWTNKQVAFVAYCILQGALDMIEGCLPSTNSTVEKSPYGPYDTGVLESAGEALSIFFAQVTGDGVGCYDALKIAGDFAKAIDLLVTNSWADGGKAIREAIAAKEGNFSPEEVYPNWPNINHHAKAFANKMFSPTKDN